MFTSRGVCLHLGECVYVIWMLEKMNWHIYIHVTCDLKTTLQNSGEIT